MSYKVNKIEKDDVNVATNVDILNFEGNVSVVDDGGGKATVTVTAGGVSTFQITGSDAVLSEPMAFVTDTTRASKILSVESNEFDFGHDAPGNNSWFRPGNNQSGNALNGYIMPYDGTVIRLSTHTAKAKSNTKNISVFINAIETTNVVTLTGAGEDQDEATNVNIDFSAGNKLRVRARNGLGARMDETLVSVWVKWRKV